MVILDITIVNVALPSIGADLHFSAANLQWVITGYVLCSGGLLLLGGRAADSFGRRRMFLLGVTLFTTASLICGLAPTAAVLVAGRAAQGTGAALLTPAALSIITTTYDGAQRATALSVWGAIASAGIGVGVLLGGMLTTWLSWHWVFLVNAPVGIMALALALIIVPGSPSPSARRALDPLGGLSVVAGLATLVYALSGVADYGWGSSRTIAELALAATFLLAFALIERRVADPVLAPSVWRVGSLVSGAGVMLGGTGIIAGAFFLNSLYLQEALGWSALATGLAFLPFVIATAVGVHVTSHVIGRAGSKPLLAAGFLLAAAGALLFAAAPTDARYTSDLLPGFVIFGLGMGLAFPAISITAMSQVTEPIAGVASGLMSTAHEVGAALGVAVLSAVTAAVTSTGASFGTGWLVAAVIAAALAAVALAVVPSVRPSPGTEVRVH
jgi:EmrB/QacA subfamily drug resistance transporter